MYNHGINVLLFTDDYFLFATGGDQQLVEQTQLAIIHTREFHNPGPGQFRFWHVSESPSAPGLYVNITENGKTTTAKKFRGFAHHWTERIVVVPKAGKTVLTIVAAPTGHGIDELEYTRDAEIAVYQEIVGPYERPLVKDATVSCSFQRDFCGWAAYPGLPGKWSKNNGKGFPSNFVQGSSNQWLDKYFLSVQEKKDLGEDSQAAIISHTIKQFTSSWLSFWWAKFEEGHHAKTAIFVKLITKTATETLFYSKLPALNWTHQNITIPSSGGQEFQILIGFQLNNHNSIGALDEIEYAAELEAPDELTTPGYITEATTEGSGYGPYGEDIKEFLF